MREIKFRAWDKEKDELIPPEALTEIVWNKSDAPDTIEYNDGEGLWQCLDFILMQYTGLKDKSGVEIYEGDIVKYHSGADIVSWTKTTAKFNVLNFYDASQDCPCCAFSEYAELEVIGNIYENPELLGD